MLKIDEAIHVFARSYIFFEMMLIFIREILQFLIIRYKKIDDQIKKQLHKKFQTLKQSSFKN
jgi:cell division protein FtsB